MTNWKTTSAGLVSAFFGFVAFAPEHFSSWLVHLAKYVMAGGLATLGFMSRDFNSHSTVEQTQRATEKEKNQ
jgi:hypothetical protein